MASRLSEPGKETRFQETRFLGEIGFLRLVALAAPLGGWMALAALLGALTIGSSIGLMAVSAYIIARAALHPSIAELAVPIVGVRFFGISRGVFRYLERYLSHRVNLTLLANLRVWFYRGLEPLAPARLWQYQSGDLLSRIVGDIETLQNLYVRVLAPPLVALAIAGLTTWFLWGFSPLLAWIVLGFMFLVGGIVPLVVQSLSRGTNRRMVEVRSTLQVQLLDSLQGMADAMAFGQEHAQAERVNRLSREWVNLQRRMASLTGLHSAVGGLLTHLAMGSVLLVAIPMVRSGQLDGVLLSVLALGVAASFEGVLALPPAFQYLETNLAAARRLFEIIDAPNPMPICGVGATGRSPLRGEEGSVTDDAALRVHDLSFRYSPDAPLALDHVSFDLEAGKTVAVVGPSGAGKSTLVNLLLRFWDYETGRIVIGGRDLCRYAPEEARRLLAVVSQSTYLFNATVRENLLLARPQAGEAEMIRAAQQAQVHDFICSLPQGYDTQVGEQGLKLSGGERQRLAIARALLKESPILLLDEPTANLDPWTEHQLLAALRALPERRTTLWITHRLAGLEQVDEILVLRAGRVIERGRHGDLQQANGLYRRMWELQNQRLWFNGEERTGE